MAVVAEAVTVTTTATLLSGTDNTSAGQRLLVKVPSGGSTVYVGDADVDDTDGFPVAAGESVDLQLESGETLYSIVASTQATNVVRLGVA